MPHITTAMERSVRRSVVDYALGSLLGKRDIVGEVDSVKNTFSSWDNCMAQSYCKWPVIVLIVIAGLIVFGVLWCIIRCACCGMSCCCTCFSFLKCCDCCGGCCDGKKDKPHKHLDDPYLPSNQGYKAPEPMMGGALAGGYQPPQYAQFEVGKNGLAVEPKNTLSEDALPPMPSWDQAAKKHVLTEEEQHAVELGELDPVTGQKIPLMTGAAPAGISSPPSPANEFVASPYSARPGQAVGGNGYMSVDRTGSPYGPRPGQAVGGRGGPTDAYAAGGRETAMGGVADPYGQNQTAYNQNGRGYGGQSVQDRGYGPTPGNQGYGAAPQQDMDNYEPPSPVDPYSTNNNYTGVAVGGYGRAQPQNNGRPYPPQPNRQYSSDSARPLNPGRQYSDRSYQSNAYPPSGPPRSPSRGPGPTRSPPLNNNSGFDFGGGQQHPSSKPSPPPQQGYGSRPSLPPQQDSYGSSQGQSGVYSGYNGGGSTAPPSYASRSPTTREDGNSYQAYNPNRGRGGPPQGRGREPQNWDPVQR